MTIAIPPVTYIRDVLTTGRSRYESRSDWLSRIAALVGEVTTVGALTSIWADAKTAGVADAGLQTLFRTRRDELNEGEGR